MRLGLVGCSAGKRAGNHPAAMLYNSRLFVGRCQWVGRTCDTWAILSAKHGLLHPLTRIDSYNLSLEQLSAAERRVWSDNVARQITRVYDLQGSKVELHAGETYLGYGLRAALRAAGAVLVEPMSGLGIGQQLQRYKQGPPCTV